jgi:hypothetical protein
MLKNINNQCTHLLFIFYQDFLFEEKEILRKEVYGKLIKGKLEKLLIFP